MWHPAFQSILGILTFAAFAWGVREKKGSVAWRQTFAALGLHGACAFLLTTVPWIRQGVWHISQAVLHLKNATQEGTRFVFGYLGGGDLPFQLNGTASPFVFAFQALPMILVISALSMVLFHWNILPPVVRFIGRIFRKTLGINGPLSVLAGAKIFLGQTDAPLLIRPYLGAMSRSDLFSVIVCGMATTSSAIMVVYASILESVVPNPLQHILTVSVISIPAALFFSRLMVPPSGASVEGDLVIPFKAHNTMDAIAQGTSDGLKIFLGVIAMLIVMLALVALANTILGALPLPGGPWTIQSIAGWVMAPVGWLMGIPWSEAPIAGQLLGTKIVTNEMVAFLEMTQKGLGLSPEARLIMTYALCGFANLSSIGIVLAAFHTLAPERRAEVSTLAPKAVLAGTLATCLSGTTIGLLNHLFS